MDVLIFHSSRTLFILAYQIVVHLFRLSMYLLDPEIEPESWGTCDLNSIVQQARRYDHAAGGVQIDMGQSLSDSSLSTYIAKFILELQQAPSIRLTE